MKVSEILRAAKAKIEARGWCQGDEASIFGPPDGPCCAGTAIARVPTMGWPFGGEWPGNASMLALKAAAGIRPTDPIAGWNDAPERTLADVLFAYDLAIAAAEQQEQTP